MRYKKLLAIILLSLSLCFVSGVGYGEIDEWMNESKASYLNVRLLEARVDYMMRNPNSFLGVNFTYDRTGYWGEFVKLPKSTNTKGKVCILITDNRDRFSNESGISLLNSFKKNLEAIYSFIKQIATNMDTDITAALYSREEIPLACFYQGGYRLWED